MCNLNLKCQVWDGSCNCFSHTNSSNIIHPIPVPFMRASDSSILTTLLRMITQQNEMIRAISTQTTESLEKIKKIEENLVGEESLTNSLSDGCTSYEKLIEMLCFGNNNHSYFLQPISDIPNPAYKERAFSLFLQIVDINGNKVNLSENTNFTIELYNSESPPKCMKINTAGDKIIRGTLDIDSNSVLFFRKIVIKEVSSHFRNGSFFLVVLPKKNKNIKPFVIKNFVVKARKLNSDVLKKKQKLEESSNILVNN